jgi:hypothetical protein
MILQNVGGSTYINNNTPRKQNNSKNTKNGNEEPIKK